MMARPETLHYHRRHQHHLLQQWRLLLLLLCLFFLFLHLEKKPVQSLSFGRGAFRPPLSPSLPSSAKASLFGLRPTRWPSRPGCVPSVSVAVADCAAFSSRLLASPNDDDEEEENSHQDNSNVIVLESPSSSSSSVSVSSAPTASSPSYPQSSLEIIPLEWRGQVLSQLRNVIDPDLGVDIVTLGFVKNLKLLEEEHDKHKDEHGKTITATTMLTFDLELTTPACPVKEQFIDNCQQYIQELPWIQALNIKVQVTLTAQPTTTPTDDDDRVAVGLRQIGAIVAVSSCKGGVGKSTTAVNLAFALQALGGSTSSPVRVGIFDADLYGPSLPTMVTPDDDVVRFVGRQIAPLERHGVKLMSFGYINDGSAVMRGPMVTQLLDQLIAVTHWGPLDYLILDLPPGTGDIQLTLTQRLNITAAVVVTTPQELSFADVVRGVEMFDTVNVPCIAVVENMAYYEVDKKKSLPSSSSLLLNGFDHIKLQTALTEKLMEANIVIVDKDDDDSRRNGEELPSSRKTTTATLHQLSADLTQVVLDQIRQSGQASVDGNNDDDEDSKERIPIFGPGHKHRLSGQYGIEHTFSLPLLDRIAANGDSGQPFVLEHAQSPAAAIYRDLAKAVVTEVAKIKYYSSARRPTVVYEKETHEILIQGLNTRTTSTTPTTTTEAVTAEVLKGREEEDTEPTAARGVAVSVGPSPPSRLTPATLRRACRCAFCVEELTGRQILIPATIPESVYPLRMNPTGNYALSVDWSDGHKSLYPYRQIQSLLSSSSEEATTTPTTTTTAVASTPH